ncbi:PadR family transcriptional regulator [Streptomyces sp. H27-D2]|uniref:PadR family transcriptional regulator n=1 Tax=Streptomyces sp. H27-D2 TaxID=3046304 RepID=UPI002DB929C5|nr:helix-turn-helix transcriptional regulator [Streptomyces sp. H27-D2]MEC4018688.1 helix-turn-helix transcriptional regulator [Streptomyces sp. H27-D2]
MPPVFAHGRLRLYLLKLLDEAPRHGYEVIRLLEERFDGLYAPSAGTVYPRLSKLEAEGLVTHATEGGRKVYSITDAGRAELADRQGELADLELEIRESVSVLAAEIRDDVRGSADDLRREMREAAQRTRTKPSGQGGDGDAESSDPGFPDASAYFDGAFGDKESWRQAREEFRRAKDEWKEQARRAKEESRRARQDAQRARKQAKDAQDFAREEVQRIAKRVQEQTQDHLRTGDWQSAVREGLAEVSRGMSRIGDAQQARSAAPGDDTRAEAPADARRDAGAADVTGERVERVDLDKQQEHAPASSGSGPLSEPLGEPLSGPTGGPTGGPSAGQDPAEPEPEWARDTAVTDDPSRDLDRLLDRFRDDIRDAARDHGVSAGQLKDARRHLSTAAARIGAALRAPSA